MRKREDFPNVAYNPRQATRTLPASEERIQVYRSRVAAHQGCFREGDLEEDLHRGIHAIPNGLNGKPKPVPRLENEANVTARTDVRLLKISSIIRLYRKMRGWTAKELAKRSKLSVRCIEYYEAGDRRPGYSALKALADAFGIAAADFFCGER